MNIALIVASGKGTRIHSAVPKQFIEINGKSIISYTIETFEKHELIDQIIIVSLKEYISTMKNIVNKQEFKKVKDIVAGGETRQDSVRNGLNAIGESNHIVLIHDGDRPFISHNLITKLLEETKRKGNAVPVVEANMFPKYTSNSGRKIVINNVEYNVQTPQCFICNDILTSHNRLKNSTVSDDASLLEIEGNKINYCEGEKQNIKITTQEDLEYIKALKENE